MDTTPFQYALEELSQYISGAIILLFDNEHKITLDLFFDFNLCYEDILNSIQLAKKRTTNQNEIWFCEQGSDFISHMK